MTRLTFATLAGAVLLCGCASQPAEKNGNAPEVAERGEATLGTLFPQKNKNRPTNSITANTQDMENSRIMNAGTNPTLK
jgi:hypothetical protein